MCGDGILEDERYKAFMNGFGPDVHVSHGLRGLSYCFEAYAFIACCHVARAWP
jgi:hypothetical protein